MSKQRIILELCKQLRLGTYMAETYKTIEAETNEDFLISLLRVVVEERDIERKNRYLKQAGFDVIKSFANYSFDYVQLPEELSVDDLKECTFIENKQNLILFGKPGTGKTHLATAIGVEACRKGNRVAYYKTSRLVNDLVEAMASKNLESIWKKLLNAKLVILDEWGYIPFEKTGTQLLFEVISECYEQRSVVITTNLPFNEWNTIFYDEKLTNAILDRMVHHGYLILHNGPSFRLAHSTMRA
jgi:DNA replication protein DnaC